MGIDGKIELEKFNSLIEENKLLQKALELSCEDGADDCCPYEMMEDYETAKCLKCPAGNEIHQDTKRDIKCWKTYYLVKAKSIIEHFKDYAKE